MKQLLIVGLVLLALGARAGAGDNDSANVVAVVNTLFDGMREGDSAKVRSVFRPDVRMLSVFTTKTGEQKVHQGSLDNFVEAVGKPHEQVWDEKLANLEVRIDGNLAQVWTDYAFYLGSDFLHCGVDAFHLVRQEERWLIIQLTDTRRKRGCEKQWPESSK